MEAKIDFLGLCLIFYARYSAGLNLRETVTSMFIYSPKGFEVIIPLYLTLERHE